MLILKVILFFDSLDPPTHLGNSDKASTLFWRLLYVMAEHRPFSDAFCLFWQSIIDASFPETKSTCYVVMQCANCANPLKPPCFRLATCNEVHVFSLHFKRNEVHLKKKHPHGRGQWIVYFVVSLKYILFAFKEEFIFLALNFTFVSLLETSCSFLRIVFIEIGKILIHFCLHFFILSLVILSWDCSLFP